MDKLEPMHEPMETWRYSPIQMSGFGILPFPPIVPMECQWRLCCSVFKIHHFYTRGVISDTSVLDSVLCALILFDTYFVWALGQYDMSFLIFVQRLWLCRYDVSSSYFRCVCFNWLGYQRPTQCKLLRSYGWYNSVLTLVVYGCRPIGV